MGAPSRRIVVALDNSAGARAAMEAAAELAARIEAEVLALFVEDVELLHLAGLPFVREIGSDALARPFDRDRLERRLRMEARAARAVCAGIAERSRARVRFEIVRGAVAREILAAAEQADMIVLGRASREAAPRRRPALRPHPPALGRTTSVVLASSTRTVAVVTAEHALGRPVAVLYDGTESCRRALDLAIQLAGEDHRNLVVLVTAPEHEAVRIGAEAVEIASRTGIRPRVLVVPEAQSLASAILQAGCRAVVVDRSCANLAAGGGLVAFVAKLDCPVFVVG